MAEIRVLLGRSSNVREMFWQLTSRTDIVLRPLNLRDVSDYFDLIHSNRGHLSQWGDVTSSKYPDRESVRASIKDPENPHKVRMGIWCFDNLVGTINLTPLASGVGEIGYLIGEAYCGQGLATVAVLAMVKYAFARDYEHLIAACVPENTTSQRVLEKVGFVEEWRGDEEVVYSKRATS